MELTTIEEIKAQNEIAPKKALDKLLEKMEELAQGKIQTSEYEKARDSRECVRCNTIMDNDPTDWVTCRSCRYADAQRVASDKELENWFGLVTGLNNLGTRIYKVELTKFDTFITAPGCKIYRDQVCSGRHSYRASKNVLRISTDDYDVNAKRLMKDFGAPNVAKSLDKKCTELLETIASRARVKIQKAQKVNSISDKIKEAFPESTPEAEYSYRYGSRRDYLPTGAFKFKHDNFHVLSYDGVNFTACGQGKLTADQVRKITAFIIEITKDN